MNGMKKTIALLVFSFLFITNPVFAENPKSTPSQAEIITQLQEQIKSLQAQIEQLTTELAVTKQDIAAIKEELRITKTLKLGMTDEEVKKLQEFLSKMPDIYPAGLVTGYFGPLTENAVKKWQELNGIDSVGIVGPITRSKISEVTGGGVSSSSSSSASPNISTNSVNTNTSSSTSSTATSTTSTQTNNSNSNANSNSGNGASSSTQTTPLFMCPTPGQMVTICHNSQTLAVSCNATGPEGHSNHGSDALGACSTTPTDTTAPVISSIQSTKTETTATITWSTNELSDSKIVITTPTIMVVESSIMTTSHSLIFSNLNSGTTYNYVIVSKDTSGNISTSSNQTIVTNLHVVRSNPTRARQADRTNDKIYWVLGFSSGHYAIENVEVRETPFCVFTAQSDRCRIEDIWNQQPKLSYPVYNVAEGIDAPNITPVNFNQKFLITISNLSEDKGYALIYDIVDTATGYRWKSDFWGVDRASFKQYLSVSGNGSVTPCVESNPNGCPSGYSPTFRSTTAVSFTPYGYGEIFYISPDVGFKGILTVDGNIIGESTEYQLQYISTNHTINVTFVPIQ